MHNSYEIKLGHPPDFKVRYKFYSEEEGGRTHLPFQGIRFDFWYEHPNHLMKGIFIIWPEFEDESGNIILDSTIPVPVEGIAKMWILSTPLRQYHQERIRLGTKGYFMEGKKVANCSVIELVGLMTNPTAPLPNQNGG